MKIQEPITSVKCPDSCGPEQAEISIPSEEKNKYLRLPPPTAKKKWNNTCRAFILDFGGNLYHF